MGRSLKVVWFMGAWSVWSARLQLGPPPMVCFQLLLFSDGAQCEESLITEAKRLMDLS